MADKKDIPTYTFTSAVRIGFEHILKAEAYQENGKAKGEPKFDATFILEPDSADLKALQSLVTAELRGLFPGKKLVARRLTQDELDDGGCVEIQVPWKSGDKEADKAKAKGKEREWARGKILLKTSSKYEPALSSVEKGAIVAHTDPAVRPSLARMFYSGSYVVPMVGIHTYPAKNEKPGGAALYLNAVCFIKKGEKLAGGGSVNAAEVFKNYAGTVTTEDPTGGAMDDEIPF